ncbi:uncharacterized protein BO97DRAFT_435008 [Aspergillus homomorphus CBS 101889]|uniref:C2H2-type domain-containing protein n=1 Tax=Aspergillus homomorphus (strain CBS 101889) TaxID=1450537 RepID=A0A395HUV4_ASPHC|nr:hypothetical protein BO97DRAFT_435008 [Aspergillus homomorphus CBS 101889]RAL11597.1 hypothetical protein BO97DRAFT_435008 [Aspergillus homomorphus CBS 101889]
MDNRPASEYAQSGSHFPYPLSAATPHSELPAADQASAAATAQYTPQPEVRPTPQYTPQPEVRPAANISSSNTPQSDYGLNQPPAARSPAYPEYLARPPQYHHAPNTQPGGAAGMAQATSPSMTTLNNGQHHDPRNHHTNVKSDADVPIDPSIAASSPTYPPPYSPYQPQGHEMAQYQGHPPPPPPQMYTRPEWSHGYGQHQHGLPGPYTTPATTVGPASPAATAGPRPGQVYSFVPIPGAQQHKRPRRRYEEIERMYKCGWNGCEKAYGTLNHLNAHVTMQSHGAKRTPEEFKEIRKEWKARKKEEEAQRKAAEERERAAAAQAAQANQVDAPNPADPAQGGQPPAYPGGVRPQLPPIGYQPADGQVPGQYGAGAGGMVYQGNGQMAYPPNYPHSPYGQAGQVYQPLDLTGKSDCHLVLVLLRGESSKAPKVNRELQELLLKVAEVGTSPRLRMQEASLMGDQSTRKQVEMELRWLVDPRRLADRVGRLLQGREIIMAAALLREAQKQGRECIVAWNHLLEYCMKQGATMAAYKFYTDMKKRGRKPSSYTYTIMLNGFSNKHLSDKEKNVDAAMRVYRSIEENPEIERDIIHSNAMLKVCWLLRDMDTLWRVAGDLPEDGPGSPDSYTYTIILRAIMSNLELVTRSLPSRAIREHTEKRKAALTEGKRVWADVAYRWKKGQLEIDNHLVQAMAELLLNAYSDYNCYEVLALYNQTAGLPIFMNRPSPDKVYRDKWADRWDEKVEVTKKGRRDLHAEPVPFVNSNNEIIEPETTGEAESLEEEPQEEEENFDHLFDPVTDAPGSSKPKLITITNREIDTVLEACLTMIQGMRPGKQYWNYLTREGHPTPVQPDAAAIHQYLRLLRYSRSTREAVTVIRDQMLPFGLCDNKTFHIAMSICRRDTRNANVLRLADEMLDIMGSALVLAEPRALVGYLELVNALKETPQLLLSLLGFEGAWKAKASNFQDKGRSLNAGISLHAIDRVFPHLKKLNEATLPYLPKPKDEDASTILRPDNRDLTSGLYGYKIAQAMNETGRLVDEVLTRDRNKKFLSKEDRGSLQAKREMLKKYSNARINLHLRDVRVSATASQAEAFEKQQEEQRQQQELKQEEQQQEPKQEEQEQREQKQEGNEVAVAKEEYLDTV